MELVLGGFASGLGALGLFGGIALLVWVSNRTETEKRKVQLELDLKQRQIEHAERLKALEAGHPLPDADIAAARAEGRRAWAGATVGFVVPPAVFGLALASTAVVLGHPWFGGSVPVLCVLWAAAGATSIVALSTSAGVLMRRGREARATGARDSRPVAKRGTTAVTEQVPDMQI